MQPPRYQQHVFVRSCIAFFITVICFVEQGGSVTSESLEWLPDLLFRLCASNPSSLCDAQKEHQNCVIRQCQILLGVTSVVTSQNYKNPLRV